ncbi:non-ribosomal peptide synthetase [Nocardiopsis alkaliphila]|uniref:non-ribosomal peptide synthetase n=1 Tax=Nocardiopsis alkaliphila TaxID=225762 RepID=UPI00034DD2D0|nr:non-ribosomal peptide synthetase [Nocardiopsis alkaliphila]
MEQYSRTIEDQDRTFDPSHLTGVLPDRVREHAEAFPDRPAVRRGQTQLTYAQLDRRVDRLACTLIEEGVSRGSLVAIHIERSIEWVVAMLATLRAGGVCMTLDPRSPLERIERALEVARPVALLSGQMPPPSDESNERATIRVDHGVLTGDGNRVSFPELGEDDLAYAVHTSGSEGRPKIVLAQHRWLTIGAAGGALINGTTAHDRGSWLGPAGAGIAINEVCGLLWMGASIHIAEQEVLTSPVDLRAWLLENRITQTFVITPIGEVLQALEWPEHSELRLMTLGGDRLNRWGPSGLSFEVAVSYGSLEAFQIANSIHPWDRRCTPTTASEELRRSPPPVGRALPGVRVHVLENDLERTPAGSIGELWIESNSLSLGYMADSALTADRFRPNPFGAPGSRLYRSGDAGRFREDGLLEHHGRIDGIVKVRGNRVEIGEVEWVLGGHPDVEQVCVATASGRDQRTQLVACVVARNKVDPIELRSYAALRLQDFMVPIAYVLMDALPMNTNHKIDRGALPPADWERWRPTRPFREPKGDTEETLAALYTDLIGVERVGADDGFLELGGDSLLAVRLRVALESEFGITVPLREIMERSTVSGLARRVVELREKDEGEPLLPPIVRRSKDEATRGIREP